MGVTDLLWLVPGNSWLGGAEMGWIRKREEAINRRALELYTAGLRPYIIARRLGVSTPSIIKRLKRCGVYNEKHRLPKGNPESETTGL